MIEKRQSHHKETIWVWFASLFLGFWLLTGPIIFGYTQALMVRSDAITGIVVIIASLFALSYKKIFAPWLICFAGLWLEIAPLIFWAKDPSAYLQDTLIGVLLIGLSILIPGIPGKIEEKGKELAPGWNYNPSSWVQRIPIIVFGTVGWFIARYLAAYQLGYIDTLFEPFFENGTKEVITSNVARFFPVSDAGLGAFAYTLEVILGCKGGPARWRTMPWLVVGFGILVVPLGITSIILVILQPLLVGAWCTLCLVTAFCMLFMCQLTLDEVVLVCQFLRKKYKEKQLLRTLIYGGNIEGTKDDPASLEFPPPTRKFFADMVRGGSLQWSLALTALLGILSMFLPNLLSIDNLMADVNHTAGALIVVVSVISMAEVARSIRFINIILALWITIGAFFNDISSLSLFFEIALASVVLIFTPIRGPIKERYGGLESSIR